MSLSEFSTELNQEDLHGNDNGDDKEEYPVGNQSIEDIVLGGTNLAAVEFVEDMHPCECVEDHGEYDVLVG